MENNLKSEGIKNAAKKISSGSIISYDELPKYDLFLSQVIDYLNDNLGTDEYTSNIVQNYIKSEVISKPEDGKKRGYTKLHLVQLILLSYMRPIMTTDEIKKVFKLAFNEINDNADDLISWEAAYRAFSEFQKDSLEKLVEREYIDEEKLKHIIKENNFSKEEIEKIQLFLTVMTLIAQASTIKKLVENIVSEYEK